MHCSRRSFGRIALAGLPASLAAAARINPFFKGVELGCISYSYRDRSLDAAIKEML